VRALQPVGPLTIRALDAEVEMDKRTHLPVEISSTCPGCGVQVVQDMTDRYLSYPIINKPKKCNFYHECADGKDTEWEHQVVVRVTLEEVLP
jgi:hypothetical protein